MSSRTLFLGRRRFVQASLAASGAMVFGCGESPPRHVALTPDVGAYFNAWLEFSRDNKIVLTLDKAEMGQGLRDSFAMIVADEMEIDPAIIDVEFATLGRGKRNPLYTPTWGTAGSTSVRALWRPLRHAGALARLLFCRAAAAVWQVEETECVLADGCVRHRHSGREMPFAELLERVNLLAVPSAVDLRAVEQTAANDKRTAPSGERHSALEKTSGRARYGIDFLSGEIPVARVIKPRVAGATLPSSDWSEIKRLPGVLDCFPVPSGLAIIATSFWRAQQASQAVTIDWIYPESAASFDTASVRNALVAAAQKPGFIVDESGKHVHGKPLIDSTYYAPYLTHAALEPLNCSILIDAEGWEVHVGTQRPEAALATLAKISGLSPERISLHTVLIGGSFGRRLQLDFIREAGHVAAKFGRSVKLIWPREDDLTGGFYRPAMAANFRVVSDRKETLHWQARVVSSEGWPFDRQSIAARLNYRWQSLTGAASFGQALEGLVDSPYEFSHRRFEVEFLELPVSAGQWRSTGNSFNTFFLESAVDEVAHALRRDTVALRMELLANQPRVRAALGYAQSIAQSWDVPSSSGIGYACHLCYDTAIAVAVQVSVVAGAVNVLRIACAVDCGLVIDADGVRAQIEGGALFGLCAALYGQVEFDEGRVSSTNFDRYPVLRMSAAPHIEIKLLPGGIVPGGVGEAATPLAAPALCNAIFAATGLRIRTLPVVDAMSAHTSLHDRSLG